MDKTKTMDIVLYVMSIIKWYCSFCNHSNINTLKKILNKKHVKYVRCMEKHLYSYMFIGFELSCRVGGAVGWSVCPASGRLGVQIPATDLSR